MLRHEPGVREGVPEAPEAEADDRVAPIGIPDLIQAPEEGGRTWEGGEGWARGPRGRS